MIKFLFAAAYNEHVVDCEIFAANESDGMSQAVKYIGDSRYLIKLISFTAIS
jgi:hypothetical protein